jgi:hypothetical protein
VRISAGIAALALALSALSFGGTAAAYGSSADGIPAVLATGKCLVANSDGQGPGAERESISGVFALRVTGDSAEIDETETFPDGFTVFTINWWQFLYPNSGGLNSKDKTRLCMRASGNLVLTTSKGKVIWSSHTAGSRNSVRLENDGNLVMLSHRKAIWSTRTTRTIMIAGTTLRSGTSLVNRYRQQFGVPLTWLAMKRGGNLVLEFRGAVVWSSHTHVKGSHAALLRSGDFAVYSPAGRLLWQSHTRGHDAFLLFGCGSMNIYYRTRGTRWHVPAGPESGC